MNIIFGHAMRDPYSGISGLQTHTSVKGTNREERQGSNEELL